MQDKSFSQGQDTQATPGSHLRRVRRDKGLSVAEVSEATRISIKNIRAIETAAFEELPADTFVRGLVTIYGNYLELDGGKIATDFLQARKKLSSGGRPQNLTLKKVPPSTFAQKKLAEPAQISSATLALVIFLLILVSFSGFCMYTSWNPLAFLTRQTDNVQTSIQKIFAGLVGDSEAPVPQEPQKQERAEHLPPSAANNAASSGQDEQVSYRLNVHFLKNSAVTIRTDDKKPVRREFKSGEVLQLQAGKQLKLIFSVPGAATLTLNGRPLSFPEASGGASPTLLIPDDLLDR
jgi:cytoskeletal protein RodZ